MFNSIFLKFFIFILKEINKKILKVLFSKHIIMNTELKVKKEKKWIKNSEYVKKYFTDYYKNSEVIQCECYGNYKTVNVHKHLKSKQHTNYLDRMALIAQKESVAIKC